MIFFFWQNDLCYRIQLGARQGGRDYFCKFQEMLHVTAQPTKYDDNFFFFKLKSCSKLKKGIWITVIFPESNDFFLSLKQNKCWSLKSVCIRFYLPFYQCIAWCCFMMLNIPPYYQSLCPETHYIIYILFLLHKTISPSSIAFRVGWWRHLSADLLNLNW